ncbi:hypothetical protein PV327_010578 [Microctonus hyperodae]|uniref:CUB domain-containing protein n=1 Tax=Microctonus hyperodae TaxID=165561 RepID=A0AA39FS69_MICHY|nr:hypothetical protein PV327_010578 [Microctonus hyperodae]
MISHLSSKILLIIICELLVVECNVIIRDEDICGIHNGRRLYLELGEKGVLYAKNVSFIKNLPRQQNSRFYMTNSSHHQCSLELVTCPSCAIKLTFKNLALPYSCGDSGIMMDSPCRCDYVWISEPPYEDVSGAPYCGLFAPITYRSSTRTVSINLLYSQSHQHAFTLEYTAERNRLQLKGSSILMNNNINSTTGGILTSPFFPSRYPRDLGIEYIITCPSDAISCRVRVLFSDFQIATVSIIEFYDWNGQRLDVSSGARFRPPIIVSTGPSLLIRFYANGGTNLGYKAFYSYVIGHLYDKSIQPITDCGGYVENLGGAITMVNMVSQGVKTFDCVWLIRPPKNFLHMKTQIYLKVVTFTDMAGNTELIIRQGPTSDLMPLEVLRHPANQLQPPRIREHVTPIISGFHVSLRGTFGSTSRLAISYAAFGYQDCFSGSDFLCQNHRCIQSQLNCDGFDNCGDNSDEPSTCFRDWDMQPRDRKWHINKANYYFPKIDHYPDLKTATLVFVASSLGLIILISALIILLYRMGARARQQRELQSRLQTISELLDSARIDEISVAPDDPPVYEAPPGYDEVVKVGFEHQTLRKKMKNNLRRGARSRSSPNQRSRDLASSSNLLAETAGASNHYETTPILSNSNETVPESPPPPYTTPPGSIRNYGMTSLSRHNLIRTSVPIRLRTEHVRRVWHEDVEFSRSFPGPDDSTSIKRLYTSIDADLLGAYLPNDVVASMNSSVEMSDVDSQLINSRNAATNTNQNYSSVNLTRERDDIATTNTSSELITEIKPHCDDDDNNNDEVIFNNERFKNDCTCQGACGCANDIKVSFDNSCQKNKIKKLLKTGRSLSQNFNLTSTTISAIQSTSSMSPSRNPCENIFDNVSEIGRNNGDHISIKSNATNHSFLYSPSPIPGNIDNICESKTNIKHNQMRKYLSCDAESLYESIKALDTFLARYDRSHDQSVALTITHLSRNYHRRSHSASERDIFNCVRDWNSTDDAFSN